MYILYGIMGGFYHSNRYKNNTKYLWFFINVFIIIIPSICCCLGYLITTKNIRNYDALYTVLILGGNIGITILLPLLCYFFRNELEIIMPIIKNDFNFINSNNEVKRADEIEKKTLKLSLLYVVIFISYCFFYLLELALFYEESLLQDTKFYLFPTPFTENVKSLYSYVLILSIQMSCAIASSIIYISIPNFFLYIGYSFYNGFVRLSENLEKVSKKIPLSVTYNRENNFRAIYDEQEIQYHRGECIRHLCNIIRAHQIFIKCFKLIKPCMQLFLSIALLISSISQFLTYYLIFSPDVIIYQKIRIGLLYVLGNILFLQFCILGQLFTDMSEMFSQSVYSITWYDLPPKERKIVYIFLCQSQYTLQLRGFNIFTVTISLFLKTLRLVYTFTNIFIYLQH